MITDLPDCDQFIADAFNKSGRCTPSMGGLLPLNWSEINSFRVASSLNLSGFECEMIRMMSTEYIGEIRAGEDDPSRPPPYYSSKEAEQQFIAFRRAEVNRKISMLKGR